MSLSLHIYTWAIMLIHNFLDLTRVDQPMKTPSSFSQLSNDNNNKRNANSEPECQRPKKTARTKAIVVPPNKRRVTRLMDGTIAWVDHHEILSDAEDNDFKPSKTHSQEADDFAT